MAPLRGSEEISEGHREASFSKAKQVALRFLSHKFRSEAEVRRRLARGHPAGVIESVIDVLRQQGYLDDAAFAREWRRQREQHRPRGEWLLRRELFRLGVDSEVVQEALVGLDSGENAYRAGSVMARRLEGSDYPIFRRRLWAYLQRRGFDAGVIYQTVERLWRELLDAHHGDVDAETDEH